MKTVTVTRCLRIGFFSEKYFNMIKILQNGIIGVTANFYNITKYLTAYLKPKVYFTALILSANTVFKKWTTTISLKQDMFRSFNHHLQLIFCECIYKFS